jgi:site-specific DNA-methyltransferase (adenine-specific)
MLLKDTSRSKNNQELVIQGNCVQVLSHFTPASVDMVLTDPPYIAKYVSRDGQRIANDDRADWLEPAFAQIFRVLKRNAFCISFYGWHQVDKFMQAWRLAGFRPVGHLVFQKPYSSKQVFLSYQHEMAYLLAKGSPSLPEKPIGDVQQWKYSGNKLHPTQKPVSNLIPLIEAFSRPGNVILDPFCGSGSTLVAAGLSGRRYIGIELSSDYCETARRRTEQVRRPALSAAAAA